MMNEALHPSESVKKMPGPADQLLNSGQKLFLTLQNEGLNDLPPAPEFKDAFEDAREILLNQVPEVVRKAFEVDADPERRMALALSSFKVGPGEASRVLENMTTAAYSEASALDRSEGEQFRQTDPAETDVFPEGWKA